ncbi:MFS transporter [Vallicoccus soli]|uniref:MFS transporter n=2 Tax=Vallicoccus soli TaxID=2339232 RepID=A0A3A3YZ00_9ACTN|nr:MFS transporter [Vallicoccus soli]
MANLVPRMPAIKADLDLSNTALGTAIAAGPVGALVAGLAAGVLVERYGSRLAATASGVLLALVVPLVGLAPAWGLLAGAFLLMGGLDAVMDVAMNAHGLRVQRRYGRSIINGLHALWSIGAVAGGVTGSVMAGLGVPVEAHLLGAGAVLALAVLATLPHLLPGRDEPVPGVDAAQAVGAGASPGPGVQAPPAAGRAAGARRAALPALVVLGLLAALAGLVEDAGATWGTLYLTGLGAAPAVAGLGFVALQTAMTTGRLLADRVVTRYGERAVARAGTLLATAGMGLTLGVAEPVPAIVGFACAGLGVATLFPAAYHAADVMPGLPPGHGLAVVSWVARAGFLLAPPLVGSLADATSLRAALLVVPVATLTILALSGAFAPRSAPAAPATAPRAP